MRQHQRTGPWHDTECGMTLLTVAVAMVGLLAVSALAIDLVSFYLVRSEAQRAADAAALAGAKEFVDSGFTTGAISQSTVQTLAANEAQAAGNQNLVGRQNPNIAGSISSACPPSSSNDVCFNFSNANDPRIMVLVQRTNAHGNPMPTFFGKILGINAVDVSAMATAEAYNASGTATGPTFCAGCLKPLLVPNCDPVHPTPANAVCQGGSGGYFFDPSNNYAIAHPGPVSSGGVVGETWQLHSQAGPSQYYAIALGGAQSKSAWRANLAACNPNVFTCGNTLQTLNGAAVGPLDQGINTLIHALGNGAGQGQDSIDTSQPLPYPITAGANNPLVVNGVIPANSRITSSDSLVTLPVYDGSALPPAGTTVTIIGYIQLFIQYVTHTGPDDIVTAVILNISSCGTGGGTTCGGSGTTTGGGASFIPVRLVQPN